MIIVPNERIVRACILTLRDAIFLKRHISKKTTLINSSYTRPGYEIQDDNHNIMLCMKNDNEFILNNLNGPAFRHHSGKEILFILNKGYSPVEYKNNFYIKYISQLELAEEGKPLVGQTTAKLKNGGYLEIFYNSKATKIGLRLRDSSHNLNSPNDNLPADIDFIYEKSLKWYKNGKLHRTNGPAVIKGFNKDTGEEGTVEYWINGEFHSKQSFDQYFSGIESQADKDMLTDLGQSFE